MTIDEAIAHALEVAGEQQERADSAELIDILCGLDVESCKECAADHRQLAEWLTELLRRRERCAQYEVEQISNLEQYDMLSREYEILNERYKEAKKLLKLAVEDLNAAVDKVYNDGVICECCKWINDGECCCPDDGGCDTDYRWRYADEAEKLLNDEKLTT